MGLSLGMSPALALAASAWKEAIAGDSKKKSPIKNYVQLNLSEAPSRWLFDLILRPTITDPFAAHSYIVDRFDGKNYSYAPDFKFGMGLPLVWNTPFTDSSGKNRTATELLQHWGNIRGVRMLRDGHGFNNRRLVAPQAGAVSINGQISDRSNRPLASIGWLKRKGGDPMAPLSYHSVKGGGHLVIPASVGNPFAFIFNGAEGGPIDDASDELLDLVEADIRKEDPNIANYKEKRKKAKKLLKLSLASAEKDFAKIYDRYKKLERQIMLSKIPLLTDKPMPAFDLKLLKDPKVNSQKIIEQITAPYCFINDSVITSDNLIKTVEKSEFIDMPYQFALIEYLLKKEVSQSFVVCMGLLENITIESVDKKYLTYSKNMNISQIPITKLYNGSGVFDAHPVGTIPNFLHTSLFFQVFSASLVTLIDELKVAKIFDSTLIHVASEFDREPNNLCDGSDHGIDGHTSSFFSGKIKGPFILGDILKNSAKTTTYQKCTGTWGHGAEMSEIEQGYLTYENISSTVAHFLDLPSLTPNKKSLIKIENNFFVPAIRKGRNV